MLVTGVLTNFQTMFIQLMTFVFHGNVSTQRVETRNQTFVCDILWLHGKLKANLND